jgi:hypothetical protein
MTKTEFKEWLKTNYQHGHAEQFARDFNAVARLLGAKTIAESRGKLSPTATTWAHREGGLPESYAGLPFEEFLAKVLEWRAEPPAAAYTLVFVADAETADALQEIADGGTGDVADFLRTTLQAAVEDEVEIHRNRQLYPRRRRK